jgi:hypothetical protein
VRARLDTVGTLRVCNSTTDATAVAIEGQLTSPDPGADATAVASVVTNPASKGIGVS